MTDATSARRWRRRAGIAVLAGAAAAILLTLLVHTPPARRAVLRRVVATLADRFDLALQADALRYDLLRRQITLRGVELAAVQSPQVPFLTADIIEITVPSSALFGRFAIDRLHTGTAHLHIVRRADGTTNLPDADEGADGEPQPLPLARIDAQRLTVTIEDASQALTLVLPTLEFDVRTTSGQLRMRERGRLVLGDVATTIDTLEGGLSFDGRAVDLTAFTVAGPEARIQLAGTVTLLDDEPDVDLRYSGTGDARALARWAMDEELPAGDFTFSGSVAGALEAPRASLDIRSDRLTWRDVTVAELVAAADANRERIDLRRLTARVAGGSIAASGDLTLDTGATAATLSWSDIDVAALARMAGATGRARPAGRTAGSAIVSGAGADLADWTIAARTTVSAAPAAAGLAIPGSSAIDLTDGRWRLRADHRVGGVPVRAVLQGVVDARRLAASTVSGTVAMEEIGITVLLDLLQSSGLLDEPPDAVTSGQVRADGTLSGTLERPRMHVVAAATGVTAGAVSNLAADITADGTLEEMAVEARVRQGTANDAVAAGTLFPRDGRLEARLTGRLDDPAALDLPYATRVDLALDVTGPIASPAAQGTIDVLGAAYEGLRFGPLEATVDGDPERVRVALVAPELSTRARADVALDTRVAAVAVEIDDADIARLIGDTELPVAIEGRVRLTAEGEAPLDDWRRGRATLDLTAVDARVGDLPVTLAAPAHVSYEGDVVRVERLDVDLGAMRLFVAGRLRAAADAPDVAAADALRALLVGDVADALAAARATGLADVPDASGRGTLALVARVTGSAERPELSADLDLADGELAFAGHPPVRAVRVRAQLAEGWIQPLSISGQWQGSRVSADGRIPLRLFEQYLPAGAVVALPGTEGPAVLTATAESITPLVLAPFVDAATLEQIEGAVDASATLEAASADTESIRGEVRLDRLDVRIAGLPVRQREPTRITVADGVARVAAWDWAGQGATLGVQGQVRLADGEAALSSAGRFDVRLLTPFVRDSGVALSGTLAPRISIAGPITSPRIDGELALSGAEVRLREPRIIATGVDAFAVLSPQQVRITTLTGTVNGGALTATGGATYGEAAGAAGRLTGTIAGMGLELPDGLRSELNVDAAIALEDAPGGPRGAITGTVTVLRSAYREPLAVVTQLLAALRTERLAAAAVATDAFAGRVALDVRVVTDADIVVDNNLARLELGGDLRVIGTAAAPAISGRATLREGGQLFLGRNIYTIDSGTIDFVDPVTIQPELNVEASTRAGGYEIDLTLTGTPDSLVPDLRAPAAPELGQLDLASLLLTGRTLDRVPGAEGQIVAEQVIGYLSGDVLGIAGRAAGLDTVRLGGPEGVRRDPTAVAAEADPTSRLTFGKSIGRDIDLTYSQSLREGSAQTWIVDYQPIRQVNLRLVARDDHLRSYEFQHDLALGGGGERRVASAPARREADIANVAIAGETGVAEAQLRGVLRLETGDTFDFSEWQRDRERLEERLHADGRLEARVTADRSADEAGVALTYVVAAGPQTVIAVTGYEPAAAVRRELEQAWAQSVFDEFLEEEAETIVREALAVDGYVEAQVTADVTGTDPKTLAITVAPGTRALERRIEIESPDDALAEDLERWARGTGLDAWRAPEEVEDALSAELQSRGYLQARVTIAGPRIEGRTAILPVTVDPGDAFTLGEITFAGTRHLEGDRVRGIVGLVPEDRYDPLAVEAARSRIEAAYRRDGFANARVSVDTVAGAAGTEVPLVFRVEEGARQIVREISIRGNRSTDADVIGRAIGLEEGDPLAADAWLQARARLFDTGLFRRVDVTTEAMPEGGGADERPTRVVVTVEEWPAVRLRYGFQLSEERPQDGIGGRDLTPGLSADVTRRTLFGRPITLGAAAEYQRRERLGRVFMNAPTLFGLRVESLLKLERSRRNFADATFVTDRSGISWEQRMRPWPRVQVSYAYRFDRDHTFDTVVTEDIPFDVTANIARLTGSVVFDSRDDPTDTTRGSLFSSSIEAAPAALGSQFQFVRQVGQAYHFRPWRRVVFASAGQFGTVAPQGGQELLPSERFFGGGARSVRGVVDEGLGPLDFFGDPAGGRAMIVLNQEVRFPVFGWVRGVGFVDTGNVFESPGDIDFSRFVTSIGAGVRVATPFALLRADWAHVVSSRLDEARLARWTFGIGHTF